MQVISVYLLAIYALLIFINIFIIYLIGNNVPHDILKAIAVAVKLNSERESARNQEKAKTEKMLRTIEKIEFENTMQVRYTANQSK